MTVSTPTVVRTEAELEFDRQVDALVLAGLPAWRDLADECFRAWLEPLRDLLPALPGSTCGIPFVVVVPDMPVHPSCAPRGRSAAPASPRWSAATSPGSGRCRSWR